MHRADKKTVFPSNSLVQSNFFQAIAFAGRKMIDQTSEFSAQMSNENDWPFFWINLRTKMRYKHQRETDGKTYLKARDNLSKFIFLFFFLLPHILASRLGSCIVNSPSWSTHSMTGGLVGWGGSHSSFRSHNHNTICPLLSALLCVGGGFSVTRMVRWMWAHYIG